MRRKKMIVVILIVIFVLALSGGLFYWKAKRVMQSLIDSAQKATSQNTPLKD